MRQLAVRKPEIGAPATPRTQSAPWARAARLSHLQSSKAKSSQNSGAPPPSGAASARQGRGRSFTTLARHAQKQGLESTRGEKTSSCRAPNSLTATSSITDTHVSLQLTTEAETTRWHPGNGCACLNHVSTGQNRSSTRLGV